MLRVVRGVFLFAFLFSVCLSCGESNEEKARKIEREKQKQDSIAATILFTQERAEEGPVDEFITEIEQHSEVLNAENADIQRLLRDTSNVFTKITIPEIVKELKHILTLAKSYQTMRIGPSMQSYAEYKRNYSHLQDWQADTYPYLRAAFGKILGEVLWENDYKVRVHGPKSDMISFYSHDFYTNRNIKRFMDDYTGLLKALRFKSQYYSMYRHASDGERILIDSPQDTAVISHFPY
jgi:hypothetical protein